MLAAVIALIVFVVLRGSGGAPAQTSQSNLPLAPDIEITFYQGQDVTGGNRVALSTLWERKPVVLNFWAGLCPPCRAEMPDFQRVYDARKDKFILIGVDIGPYIGLGSREDAQALLRDLRITYPAGTTFDARTVRNYQVLGMPTTVFITPQGRILRKYTGLLTREQMDALLNELLKASGVL
ncbi:MAG: TlpA family protein disulfide reductase [Armatimonadetes bacterium]|nr:TlpA family protein disulfide reductase [Armatimonadota bacterium]